jgi:hypothetical protein
MKIFNYLSKFIMCVLIFNFISCELNNSSKSNSSIGKLSSISSECIGKKSIFLSPFSTNTNRINLDRSSYHGELSILSFLNNNGKNEPIIFKTDDNRDINQ